jgi:NTE family protein
VRKALVIGVKQGLLDAERQPLVDVTPNLPFLLGKTFNAVMLDPVERDIENAGQLNALVEWGRQVYGVGFGERLERDLGIHQVEVLYFKPSEDLGRMAADIYRDQPPKVTSQLGWLLGFMADRANAGESDLLSFLFFDRAYTAALEDLGYQDASRREDELAQLFLA